MDERVGGERSTGYQLWLRLVNTSFSKPILLGLLTALLGVVAGNAAFLEKLEADIGLSWLFTLRGPRLPPPEVIIVAIDRESADALALPNDPRRWPRALHAELVDKLAAAGAAVIVFDLYFAEPGDPQHDQRFAAALRAAGNVVLFEKLKQPYLPVPDSRFWEADGSKAITVKIEQRLPAIPVLAEGAVASAPFPLPTRPVRVSWYWLFKSGDVPTLPVAAFAVYLAPACDYEGLLRRLQEWVPAPFRVMPDGAPANEAKPESIIRVLHNLHHANPVLCGQLLARLEEDARWDDPQERALIRALLTLYDGSDIRYLDFYGPPRQVATLPYHKALQNPRLFRHKAVFIGFSEKFQPEQRDNFYTVFSQDDGLDLSGVEIAATAFANLLENRRVQPLLPRWRWTLLGVWGVAVGILSLALPAAAVFPLTAVLAAGYLSVATGLFSFNGTWLPLVVPLLLQSPSALLAGLVWRYRDSHAECQRMHQAFGYFLPGRLIAELVSEPGHIASEDRLVQGICIATDAEQYTALAASLVTVTK